MQPLQIGLVVGRVHSRAQLSAAARTFVNGRDSLSTTTLAPNQTLTGSQVVKEAGNAANSHELRNAYNILGLGWTMADVRVDYKCWLQRLLVILDYAQA